MVRFQADADLNQVIVSALIRRVPRVDFRTALVASATSPEDWVNRICYLPL